MSAPAAVAPIASGPPLRRVAATPVIDEASMVKKFARLRKLVSVQTWTMTALSFLLLGILPFAQPFYHYIALTPDNRTLAMVGLDMPNMTNRAVLSWATTSITEILTMGFGDLDVRLPQQRPRFTPEGWEAFNTVFDKLKIRQKFKSSQLVLTTVPSNTPVIVGQGVNPDNIYQWIVQMPIIMTYATNNNVTRKETAMITLTIVRVHAEQSAAGIGIMKWEQYNY